MKKTLFTLLLALAMVVCFCAFTASAEETAHADHCVCGGTLTGAAATAHEEECATATGWIALTQENMVRDGGIIVASTKSNDHDMFAEDTGYYYLAEDIELDRALEFLGEDNITICLNGHKLTYKESPVKKKSVFRVSATLNITDCQGTGLVENNYAGEGGIAYILNGNATAETGAVLNIYGGTFRMTDNNYTNKSGVIQVTNSANGIPGILNMYGGIIENGSGLNGGNIFVDKIDGTFNMYGGIVRNGTTQKKSDGTSGDGGNIYVNAGKFYFYGGTITGGVAANCGNDIYITNAGDNICFLDGNVGTLQVGNYPSRGITIGDNFDGKVILNSKENYGRIATGFPADELDHLEAAEGKALKYQNNAVYVYNPETAGRWACYCGGNGEILNASVQHVCVFSGKWVSLNDYLAEQAPEAGSTVTFKSNNTYFYLTDDLTVDYYLVFGESTNATTKGYKYYLDLNGYTLTGAANLTGNPVVRARGQLYISDSSYNAAAETIAERYSGAIVPTANRAFSAIYTSTGGRLRIFGGKIYSGYEGVRNGCLIGTSARSDLYDGYIFGGKVSASGGCVAVYDSGEWCMFGGQLDGGDTTTNGGNLYIDKTSGTATITDGIISGGNASKGGNIYVNKGKLNINGGVITGGTAANGGNIYAHAGSTTKTDADGNTVIDEQYEGRIAMKGGIVSNGAASSLGGNIYLTGSPRAVVNGDVRTIYNQQAQLVMDGGEIIGGTAKSGGNIEVQGEMIMNAGTITEGHAITEGGNVRVYLININDENGVNKVLSSFTMNGGLITKGTSDATSGNLHTYGITNLLGGSITDGVAATSGGNIRAFRPTQTLIGEEFVVSGGAANQGGNITLGGLDNDTSYEHYGHLIIKGTVINGTATATGGNIAATSDFFELVLDGATVTGGTAAAGSKGMYISGAGTTTVTGNTVIDEIFLGNHATLGAPVIDFTGWTGETVAIDAFLEGVVATAETDITAKITVPETKALSYADGAISITNNGEIIEIANAGQLTGLELAPLSAKYYAINSQLNGMTLTIERISGMTVILNGEKIDYVDGWYTAELTGTPVNQLVVTNTSAETIAPISEVNYLKGTEGNPYIITDASELTSVTAAAGDSTYYAINSMLNGMTLTIVANENTTVTVNGAELAADENGLIVVTLTGTPMNKVVVTNNGTEDVELVAALEWPLGSQNNPIVINGAAELTAVEAGKYYAISAMLNGNFIVIEEAAGAVILNGTALTAEGGYFVAELTGAPMNMLTATAAAAAQITDKAPEIEQPIEKFEIDVARMILGNALQFQFGVDKAKIPDTTGYYAVIEKTWADGTVTTKTISASEWGTVDKYYAIVYQGMAAKEMADTFYVTIYNADGVAVSNAKQDSVRDYVARAYKSQNAVGKTMVVDMLNYGAAAQVYFTYNTEDLANNQLTDEQKASGTAETPAMENKVVKGENYTASRFILSSSIQVQVGFKGLTKDMYAVYTYVDYRGLSREYRVEGEDFVVVNGQLAGVELSKLVYADARCLVNITVYNADGTVYGTATDSIESCAFRGNGDLFVALMKFADSARAKLSV